MDGSLVVAANNQGALIVRLTLDHSGVIGHKTRMLTEVCMRSLVPFPWAHYAMAECPYDYGQKVCISLQGRVMCGG